MLTKMRAGMAGLMITGALLAPVATATTAQAATCAHYTTGVCRGTARTRAERWPCAGTEATATAPTSAGHAAITGA
jgi:hypothetical protein